MAVQYAFSKPWHLISAGDAEQATVARPENQINPTCEAGIERFSANLLAD